MHLYFIARGRKRFVELMRQNIEDTFVPFKQIGEDGKKRTGMVQLVPREVKLYELVFPEDQVDTVLPLLGDGYVKKGIVQKIKKMVARVLGLEPIPEEWAEKVGKGVHPHVGMHLVGIKRDEFKENGNECL